MKKKEAISDVYYKSVVFNVQLSLSILTEYDALFSFSRPAGRRLSQKRRWSARRRLLMCY